jgi:hypothetical protein
MNEGLTELWDIDGVDAYLDCSEHLVYWLTEECWVPRGMGDRLAYRTRLAYPCLAHYELPTANHNLCHQTLRPSR